MIVLPSRSSWKFLTTQKIWLSRLYMAITKVRTFTICEEKPWRFFWRGGGSLDKSRLVTYLVGINNSLSISFVQSKKKVFLSSIKLRSFRMNVNLYEYCHSETKTPEKHSRVNSVNRMVETKRVEVTTESSVVHRLEFLIYLYIYIHHYNKACSPTLNLAS